MTEHLLITYEETNKYGITKYTDIWEGSIIGFIKLLKQSNPKSHYVILYSKELTEEEYNLYNE